MSVAADDGKRNQKANEPGLDPAGFVMLPNVLLTDQRTREALDELTGRQWLVFLVLLAHRAAKSGEAFPSMVTIAAMIGCHVNTVQRSVKQLRASQLLTVADRRPTGDRGRVNVYRFPAVDLWHRLRRATTHQHGGTQSPSTTHQHGGGKSSATTHQAEAHYPPNQRATTHQHGGTPTDEDKIEQKGEPLRELGRSRLAQQRRAEDATIVPLTPEEIAALVEQHGLGEPTTNGTAPKSDSTRRHADNPTQDCTI